jgi:hypothetical protein
LSVPRERGVVFLAHARRAVCGVDGVRHHRHRERDRDARARRHAARARETHGARVVRSHVTARDHDAFDAARAASVSAGGCRARRARHTRARTTTSRAVVNA